MKKVLIIDDHAMTRDLVRWALKDSGFDLHQASNGDTGLRRASEIRPDLILLDVMMPGEIDGYMVCERLRASGAHPHLKIILLSANDTLQDKEKGQQAGANAYLVKPFVPAALRTLAVKLLQD